MTTPVHNSPRTLVLSTKTWERELAAELVRLGHSPAKSRYVANKLLKRIVGRAGWQRQAFLVD